MPDELAEIAVALDTDPRTLEVPRLFGVCLTDHHATLLLELCGALDCGVDEVLQDALQIGLETKWRVTVHAAEKGVVGA